MTEVKEIDVFDEARLVWLINNELSRGGKRKCTLFTSAGIERDGRFCYITLTDDNGTNYVTDSALDFIQANGYVDFITHHLMVEALKFVYGCYAYELSVLLKGVA